MGGIAFESSRVIRSELGLSVRFVLAFSKCCFSFTKCIYTLILIGDENHPRACFMTDNTAASIWLT